jgi:SAM-dependent methyltransferase
LSSLVVIDSDDTVGASAKPGAGVDMRVWAKFGEIIAERGVAPKRALEVGGRIGPESLLLLPQLVNVAERICINLEEHAEADGIVAVQGNANRMPMFDDDSFDLVVSNATLEHDRKFWLTVEEMRRVLRPGGLLMIGVPSFKKDPQQIPGIPPDATLTYKVHMWHDYYRFSPKALKYVFFEGFDDVAVRSILRPPRTIGHGVKPS